MKKNNKNSFKATLLILWPLLLFIIGTEIYRTPAGFSLDKIRSNFAFEQEEKNEIAAPAEEFKALKDVFSQEFHYLGSGAQCYVFASKDEEYVIKFFKMSHLTPKYWLNYVPFPWLEKYRLDKIDRRERQRKETFDSFKIAFEELKGQTGLVFIHFHKTFYSHDKLAVIDKKGKKHLIPLNTVPFVLQKKAEMIYPHIADLMKKRDQDEAIKALRSVLALVKVRCQKGLVDKDDGVSGNYGFIGNQAVDVDMGQLMRQESMKEPINYLREILRVSKKIDLWLQGAYPELCPLFQEEVQKILSNEDFNSF